jgi:hypothetical protein
MGLIDEKKTEGRKSPESSAMWHSAGQKICIALSKSTKVSSHAAFFKETIYQKITQILPNKIKTRGLPNENLLSSAM